MCLKHSSQSNVFKNGIPQRNKYKKVYDINLENTELKKVKQDSLLQDITGL